MKTYLFLFAILFNLSYSQQRNQPTEIKSKSDFTHKTGIIFPKEWNGFKRDRLVSYDQGNNNIGVTYYFKANKNITNISIYIYPAEVSNENLRDQFLSFKTVVHRNSTNQPDISPEFVKLKSDKVIVKGLKSYFDYNLIVPDFMKGQKEQVNKSFFAVYDCGKWNIKFRISVENGNLDRLKQLESSLISNFDPVKIAEKYPLEDGKNANILVSKTAQRDSLMLKAIIDEAETKKEWLNTNKSIEELSSGISDFEIESHVSSIQQKLKFYNENKDKTKGSDVTKSYFENLNKIVDNGFLKDFIYAQTFGVVIYPEGEKRKTLYADFLRQNNIPDDIIELMYRIYY